jgi:hypothetical protein
MAWSTPATWATSQVVTAAEMNQEVRDNLAASFPDDHAGVSWSPTLEAVSSNPPTNSATARQFQVGPLMFLWARWSLSTSGSGIYFVTLPTASSGHSFSTSLGAGQIVGSWVYRDDSVPSVASGAVHLRAADEVHFSYSVSGLGALLASDTVPGGGGSVSNDILSFQAVYLTA